MSLLQSLLWLLIGIIMVYAEYSATVRFGEIAYYVSSIPHDAGQVFTGHEDLEPCTVVNVPSTTTLTGRLVRDRLAEFGRVDDVWSPIFAQKILLQVIGEPCQQNQDQELLLADLDRPAQVKHIYVRCFDSLEDMAIPEGPYFLRNGRLHQAYRLYPDPAGAFIVATVPASDPGVYRSLDASAYGEEYPGSLTVAVPSRLHYTKTSDRPYAGLRLAIKDIMDLRGLKTGAGSRAYTSLYPARASSAETVQRLVDLGFVIVGKVRTTQFADSEWPTADYVDYHAPFNPRGDGYLTTSGSSSGSAAAVAAYDWLDLSLGTDTLGSIRAPAAAQGIFGMRPSLGAASFEGIVPYSPRYDTIGGFARTASEFHTLAQALYGHANNSISAHKKPTKILYPVDYWPSPDEPSQAVFDTFITRLEAFAGVKRTEISLEDLWARHRPDDAAGSTLAEYFLHTWEWSANPDQRIFLERFAKEYEAETGKPPILNPQLRFKLEYLATLTDEQHAAGIERLKTFQAWFSTHVLPPTTSGSADTIIVLPWTNGAPVYRDAYKAGPQEFTGVGFFFYCLSAMAEAPELIVPAGTTPYISKYTGRSEQLPAAIGLVGPRGSDVWLAALVRDLFEDGEEAVGDLGDVADQKLLGSGEL